MVKGNGSRSFRYQIVRAPRACTHARVFIQENEMYQKDDVTQKNEDWMLILDLGVASTSDSDDMGIQKVSTFEVMP